MKKYTIEIDEWQLRAVNRALDFSARCQIGQLNGEFLSMLIHEYSVAQGENYSFDKMSALRDRLEELLGEIKRLVWNMSSNQSKGVGHSEEVNTLIDMSEVIRHAIWLNDEDKKFSYIVDAREPFHWNKKQPLIKVEKISNNK